MLTCRCNETVCEQLRVLGVVRWLVLRLAFAFNLIHRVEVLPRRQAGMGGVSRG